MISNLPDRWDMEADVVAIGSGIGGLSAAITAHDHGASALVLERSSQVGGVTALSMGELWVAGNDHAAAIGIEDSPESGFRYLQRLSMGYGSDLAILNMTVHAREALRWFEERIGLRMEPIRGCPDYYYGHSNDSVAEGRMLEAAPFPASSLGEWQEKTRLSPQLPQGLTHHDMFAAGGTANILKWDFALMAERIGRDERCLGPGLAAWFVKGALDRDIPLHVGASAEELICDGERVIGVRVQKDGATLFVKANRGVVLAVSSFERNQDFNKTMAQQLELGSIVFSQIDGSNFRLAGPLGARTARVPDGTSLGYQVPGEEDEEGHAMWRPALAGLGRPHSIAVNRAAKRFANEAFYREIFYAIDIIHGGSQTHPNFPCWTIFDHQVMEKYGFGSILPGSDWPEGFGAKADSIAELAGMIGLDAATLETTVADFNRHAEKGEDPAFGRGTHLWSHWMTGDPFQQPNPCLGALARAPFYAVELKRIGGSAIPAAGLITDHHSRAVGWDDRPIAGLYCAGNTVARMETGAMMQSGISNARGMTHGWLAALHAVGEPSDRLEQAIERLGL